MARAFRRWSMTNRPEFALMFGEPIPGVPEPDASGGEPPGSVLSFCDAFLVEFGEMWRRHGFASPPPDVISGRLAGQLAPHLAQLAGDLPIEVMYRFLSGWIRLYGMVAMEVFGHLSWALTDAEPLFETDMAAFLHQLRGNPDAAPPAA
jgi:hypothetical protein